MLVLPIMMPLVLDDLVQAAIEEFHRSIRVWKSATISPPLQHDGLVAWVRVRMIVGPDGELAGLELQPASEEDPDDDLEFVVTLSVVGNKRRNATTLKDDVMLHWMSHCLRQRIQHEGRELAHLSEDELKALLLRMCDGADSPERGSWRFHEWTTLEAALLECECRAEESRHHRLLAIRDAQPLRERREAETVAAQTWWHRLPGWNRAFLLAHIPDILSADDRIVVAYRSHTRMAEMELAGSVSES
jgi:hypothetical protein